MQTLYIIFAFLILGLSSIAQQHIGFNIGYGNSYYKIKHGESNQNSTIDYQAKPAMEFELNYKRRWPGIINFASSISYQQHNLHINESWESTKTSIYKSADYKLDNLYIKAFPEFIFGNKIRYYAQIGPSLSILLKSQVDGYLDINYLINNPPTVVHNILNNDASDIFNKFSFGFFGGLGIDFPIGENFTISVSSQFDYSINSWFKSDKNTYSSRALMFRLGANYIIRELRY